MTFLFTVLIAMILNPVSAVDYCTDVQCSRGKHTMCQFPTNSPGPKCGGEGDQSITSNQIKELLDIHNRWRDYLAAGKETRSKGGAMPQAANMGAVTWNKQIAEVAQRWARQCNYGHDHCRNIPGMLVGQNVAMTGTSGKAKLNISGIAWMWYNKEVSEYSSSAVDKFAFSMSTGHFTQWIWGNTYQIGCGYTGYPAGSYHDYFLVCNYGPAGNVMGWPLYTKGKPCSACPNGTTCGGDARYPNLCSADGGKLPENLRGPQAFTTATAAPSGVLHYGQLLVLMASIHIAYMLHALLTSVETQ